EKVTGGPAQQVELPEGQEFSLHKDGVGVAEVVAETETRPPRTREGTEFEAMAGLLQPGAEGREAVATTDVIGTLDQGGQMHRRSSVTCGPASGGVDPRRGNRRDKPGGSLLATTVHRLTNLFLRLGLFRRLTLIVLF